MSNDEVEYYDSDDVNEIERKIYHARLAGMSVVRTAELFDISTAEVVRCYKSYRMKMASTPNREREESLTLELERLDAVQSGFWQKAMEGDVKSATVVINTIINRSKLLGLDQIDPRDTHAVTNILVLGEDRAAFIEALQQGRKPVAIDEIMDEEEDTR